MMALNIFAKPVKFLLRKRSPRILDKQCSKKQYIYGTRKLKICSDAFRNVDKKKYKSLLSFRTNLLMCNYRLVANSTIPPTKYCTKSTKCLENSSPGRHQYHKDTENAVNQQINAEFNAAFAYLSMACYFGQTDVALTGCQGFFMNMYEEELEHAMVFINFQLMRGAPVSLSPINVPQSQDWKCITKVFGVAVEMEKFIKEVGSVVDCLSNSLIYHDLAQTARQKFEFCTGMKLSAVFEVAEKNKDLQLMDLISTQFMEEQNRSICDLARLLTKAKMTDNPTGAYLFDKFVYNSFVKKSKDNLMYKTAPDPKDDKMYK